MTGRWEEFGSGEGVRAGWKKGEGKEEKGESHGGIVSGGGGIWEFWGGGEVGRGRLVLPEVGGMPVRPHDFVMGYLPGALSAAARRLRWAAARGVALRWR